ncbi:MAG: endonuclease NucS domain-containing protein [Candidatus Thorarchaeota archaeon]
MNEHITLAGMSERDLEDYLADSPSQIKEGLVLLGRQFPTDSGALDLLLMDENGVLWVTELKIHADEGHLNQGLRYYDYVRTNIEAIARSYRAESHEVDPRAEPGLMLISTEFSQVLLRIVKYVNVPVDITEAIPIELPSGEKQVICRNVDYGAPYDSPDIPTREGNLAYITDEEVRKICANILDDLESKGAAIRPVKNFWFTLRKDGNLFMSLGCKRKFFSVYIALTEDRWSERIRIATLEEWKDKIEPNLSWLLA